MFVKEKKPDKTNVFKGCDAKEQSDLEKLFQNMIYYFKNLKVCHPKRK